MVCTNLLLPCRTTPTSFVDSCTIGSHQSEPNIRPVLGLRLSLAPRLFPDAHDLVQQTSRSDHLHTGLGLLNLPHDARWCHRIQSVRSDPAGRAPSNRRAIGRIRFPGPRYDSSALLLVYGVGLTQHRILHDILLHLYLYHSVCFSLLVPPRFVTL
jgi:hypothetical protein